MLRKRESTNERQTARGEGRRGEGRGLLACCPTTQILDMTHAVYMSVSVFGTVIIY